MPGAAGTVRRSTAWRGMDAAPWRMSFRRIGGEGRPLGRLVPWRPVLHAASVPPISASASTDITRTRPYFGRGCPCLNEVVRRSTPVEYIARWTPGGGNDQDS